MEVRSVEAIVRALNTAGVQYLIAGGLAVNAYGYVRFTNDIHIVIALNAANVLASMDTLAQLGYRPKTPTTAQQFADSVTRESWIRDKGMLVLQLWSDAHRRTPIDVFVSEPFCFEEEHGRASQFEIAPDVWAFTVSLDQLIKMKLEAGRPRDLEDVAQLRRLST